MCCGFNFPLGTTDVSEIVTNVSLERRIRVNLSEDEQ